MARRIRRNKPKRAAKRRAPKRSLGMLGQMARIQETVEFEDIAANAVQGLNFSLFQFARASTLAVNFKWYRAAKVVWTIDPQFNLFVEGALAPGQPYIYNRMNRTQDAFNYTIQNLQAMGAKPVKFNKQIRYTYKPNWCSPGLSTYTLDQSTGNLKEGGPSQGLKAQYGWLNAPGQLTTATGLGQIQAMQPQGNVPLQPAPIFNNLTNIQTNSCLYNGNDIFIDQLNAQGDVLIARVTCTVHWEFKDPNFQRLIVSETGPNAPAPVTAKSANAPVLAAQPAPPESVGDMSVQGA